MKYFLLITIIIANLTGLFSQNNVEFKLNFNEGDIFLTNYKLKSSSFQEVNGEQQIVKKEISYSLQFNVLPSISDSTFYIKTTYKRIKHIYDIQGNVSIIDSDSIGMQNISAQDSFLLNVEKGYNFEINKKGKVILVDSINLQDFDAISRSLINEVKGKSALNYIFQKLPNKKLPISDIWIYSDTLKGDIVNVFNKKYIFYENLKDTYIINEFADISSDEENYHEVKSYYVFYKLEGKHKGATTLYKNSCMVKDVNITESSYGTAEIKYSKDGGSVYSWPMRIENSIYVKTIKINTDEK